MGVELAGVLARRHAAEGHDLFPGQLGGGAHASPDFAAVEEDVCAAPEGPDEAEALARVVVAQTLNGMAPRVVGFEISLVSHGRNCVTSSTRVASRQGSRVEQNMN